ncbi:hydantoinase/oxoprolinase N-terminal domain-containing protein [Nonomuraea rubra]|uniref:N-methylhydantoinase A/oxoprolinase/acetone carboxylase beta subunit n=2 Tax=Nonomuraea rubra TaxID=46180 RepID=A0A7X0NVV3_9ACTN|nr:hydantoinase/oxoprolinase N-terminal domain-containing protein [Nonomuraea rubra]MBB6550356.1 N-methylhydantoinase A/oxoprolinase/acetone carboxylase beta subunit [Nonomuraea rubra]
MRYRLGVDVGGTFTDILLIDQESGRTFRAKTPSTPHDQSIGVLAGVEKACAAAGVSPDEIGEILHGTTIATNAILEGKGERVGLVTTAGFRQVLQIARSFVPGGLAGWIIWPKPEPLAALEDTVEAVERVAADGTVVTPLDGAR